jgi:hypothetical protein
VENIIFWIPLAMFPNDGKVFHMSNTNQPTGKYLIAGNLFGKPIYASAHPTEETFTYDRSRAETYEYGFDNAAGKCAFFSAISAMHTGHAVQFSDERL